MASNNRRRRPFVSTLAVTFKEAQVTKDTEKAKLEHRGNLKTLMDKYIEDVISGKAEGIRSAKEYVEVMKADLLLMGEATDRTETANTVDDVRVQQIGAIIDEDSPEVQSLINKLYQGMNIANDRLGGVFTRPEDHVNTSDILEDTEENGEEEDTKSNLIEEDDSKEDNNKVKE